MDSERVTETVSFLEQQLDDASIELVQEYVATDADGSPRFTGRQFEILDGGGDREEVADVFTCADITALALLGVPVGGAAALAILDDSRAGWSDLLTQIPTDEDPASSSGQEQLRNPASPAVRLWSKLSSIPEMGPTRTGKLLARKRPRLLPVYDTAIERCVAPNGSWWHIVAEFFTEGARVDHLAEVRQRAGAVDLLSLLRTLDVVLWMRYRGPVEG